MEKISSTQKFYFLDILDQYPQLRYDFITINVLMDSEPWGILMNSEGLSNKIYSIQATYYKT